MLETVAVEEAFKLKGRLFTITVLHLLSTELDHIRAQLNQLIAKAPRLFQYAAIAIDLKNHTLTQEQLSVICEELRQHRMIPVGIVGANASQSDVAKACGLAMFTRSKDQEDSAELPKVTAARVEKMPMLSKIISTPIRSGQQVYAEGGDLIVLSSVSHGCEILADGNIHVYGTLRGRALAGIKGQKHARIFCQNLDADLLSIAGNYMVYDTFVQHKQQGARQIYLRGDKLLIEAL